jgi:Sodium/hydrogen exchanger family
VTSGGARPPPTSPLEMYRRYDACWPDEAPAGRPPEPPPWLMASTGSTPSWQPPAVSRWVFLHDRVLMDRLRSIAFALLTPFFFLRAGTLISAPALVAGAGVITVLLAVKITAKLTGVWPVAAAFKLPRKERTYTTLLMATGLTFGSIAALFGLTHHLIDKTQYTELVTVVILSAFVPTLIAQQLFQPKVLDTEEEEALGEEDLSIIHHAAPSLSPRLPAGMGGTWLGAKERGVGHDRHVVLLLVDALRLAAQLHHQGGRQAAGMISLGAVAAARVIAAAILV